ncbi:uncharacterized protein E0L32_007801 [Thyridium curvatum]|uniref:Uncharacterized protein n=1 Tax=Thyridium curvatum TaxID=1093900 RepID=A0A507B4R8_9PEZI|nr:uncharacterized protein E0L32_007801 [Thyridium curvatum]TPX11590.1 hypothetical protein E0L32_007801 [Thyridium curvatum]
MDFAPYQSSPPEHSRPFSPPRSGPASPRASVDRSRPFSPSQQPRQQSTTSPPPLQHPQPQRTWSGGIPSPSYYQNAGSPANNNGGGGQRDGFLGGFGGGGSSSWGDRGGFVSEFDTSLGIRLDYEACLAYLACPPLGAILLLILERKSDYVRFHAWQSALLFTVIMIVHLIFSFSPVMSWLLFFGDLALIAVLTLKAYRDADTLDRFELPIIGQIASRILDDE